MAGDGGQAAKIESISLKVTMIDGKSREIRIDPDQHDSLFWSQEAIDKFALPYYTATGSPERVMAVRRQVDGQLAAAGLTIAIHKRLCTLEVADLTRDNPSFGS